MRFANVALALITVLTFACSSMREPALQTVSIEIQDRDRDDHDLLPRYLKIAVPIPVGAWKATGARGATDTHHSWVAEDGLDVVTLWLDDNTGVGCRPDEVDLQLARWDGEQVLCGTHSTRTIRVGRTPLQCFSRAPTPELAWKLCDRVRVAVYAPGLRPVVEHAFTLRDPDDTTLADIRIKTPDRYELDIVEPELHLPRGRKAQWMTLRRTGEDPEIEIGVGGDPGHPLFLLPPGLRCDGEVERHTYPDGVMLRCDWDRDSGRIMRVFQPGGPGAPPVVCEARYNPAAPDARANIAATEAICASLRVEFRRVPPRNTDESGRSTPRREYSTRPR